MSQKNVERIIGRLVTDEAFRQKFAAEPDLVMGRLNADGFELTPYEVEALRRLNFGAAADFARTIHPCLQKCDL